MSTRDSKLVVRPVEIRDAESITVLLEEVISDGRFTIMESAGTVDDQISFIRGLPVRSSYVAAVSETRILGIQDVLPLSEEPALLHVGEISTFVAARAHRSGVGRALAAETFERAKACGFRKLRANIRKDNKAALAYYRSLGFETVGVAREHARVDGKYLDEVITECFLR